VHLIEREANNAKADDEEKRRKDDDKHQTTEKASIFGFLRMESAERIESEFAAADVGCVWLLPMTQILHFYPSTQPKAFRMQMASRG